MTEAKIEAQPWNRLAVWALIIAFISAIVFLLGLVFFNLMIGPVGLTLLITAPVAAGLGIASVRPRHRALRGRALGVLAIVLGAVLMVSLYPAALLLLVLGAVFHGVGG